MSQSPLDVTAVTSHLLLSTTLDRPARFRVETTVDAVRPLCRSGQVDVSATDLDSWMASLHKAAGEERFLYSHNTYIVVAHKTRDAAPASPVQDGDLARRTFDPDPGAVGDALHGVAAPHHGGDGELPGHDGGM